MSVGGYSLSGVSLFGLILVVGIVVDDAIVVIENIYRHIERGEPPKIAAIRGAEEVGWPVLAASLTTICAFGPLMFMSWNCRSVYAGCPNHGDSGIDCFPL